MEGLAGRHALVTGGGRGIGLAIAAALTRAGASVTVLGRDPARLAAAPAAGFVIADITDGAALLRALDAARAARGPIDLLVNNAGSAESAPLARTDDALVARMLALNLLPAMQATRHVLPDMARAGFGRVVSIASTAGLKGYAYVSAYVAAKHALVGFTRAVALECARQGVTVNAVCPGFTQTDLLEASLDNAATLTGQDRDRVAARLRQHNPQDRFVRPEEVAAAVVFLCGADAAAMTGQAIAVAGGEV